MNLYTVHRWLIRVFIAASVTFGFVMIKRWYSDRQTIELVCGVAAFVVAVVSFAYLLTAPYLRKK